MHGTVHFVLGFVLLLHVHSISLNKEKRKLNCGHAPRNSSQFPFYLSFSSPQIIPFTSVWCIYIDQEFQFLILPLNLQKDIQRFGQLFRVWILLFLIFRNWVFRYILFWAVRILFLEKVFPFRSCKLENEMGRFLGVYFWSLDVIFRVFLWLECLIWIFFWFFEFSKGQIFFLPPSIIVPFLFIKYDPYWFRSERLWLTFLFKVLVLLRLFWYFHTFLVVVEDWIYCIVCFLCVLFFSIFVLIDDDENFLLRKILGLW